jgi:phospholipid/cholesterol/gamma-HCH transport system substrate-binding protein
VAAKFTKEIKTGIVLLISISLLFYGLNYLKGEDIFSKKRVYFSIYDHIDGLTADNQVQINGFKVGKVLKTEMLPDAKLKVEYMITENALQIPSNSIAKISSLDLLGTKAIVLTLGNSSTMAESGDILASDIEEDLKSAVDRRIQPLEKKAQDLIGSMDSAVTIVQNILNKDARENLSASFESIKKALHSMEKTAIRLDNLVMNESEKLERIFSNIESITSNIRKNNNQLSTVIDNFAAISDSLAKSEITETILNANKTLQEVSSILNKINRGEGTMGLLLNNENLYLNLDKSASELEKLLADMRLNPQRYVHFSIFGRKEKVKE